MAKDRTFVITITTSITLYKKIELDASSQRIAVGMVEDRISNDEFEAPIEPPSLPADWNYEIDNSPEIGTVRTLEEEIKFQRRFTDGRERI
jgi:hypothetical protein